MNDFIKPRDRLNALQERNLFWWLMVGIAMLMLGIASAQAATLPVYGLASLKVCDGRAKLAGKNWKAKATFSVETPACPRPQWITLCLF